ncbi:MAG: site-specific DNA-methyltransferase [Caldilineaceae bacterium]|nr:site-specific DNA-methyltransferase [Caldilineaceae bacterium]
MLAGLAKDAGLGGGEEGNADAAPQFDRAEELRAQWNVESGQLWQLGEHLLICGDATDSAVVTRLMGDNRAALFATDPPYLVDYDGNNHPHKWDEEDKNKDWSESYKDWDRAVEGDGLYDGFVSVAIQHAILPNAAWYCWHASRRQAMLEAVWEKHSAFVHQQIIWMKDRPVLTRSWYMWRHEPCFFGWVRGRKPPRHAEDYPHSVWEIPTIAPGQETLHPTSKPLELFMIPMRQHTLPGEICYEPFSGSGSQILAAENLGRRCRAVEKAPEYVAVALQRWSDATGKSPHLLAGPDD